MTDPKVYLLDGGSLVIDASDVHWHIDVGTSQFEFTDGSETSPTVILPLN